MIANILLMSVFIFAAAKNQIENKNPFVIKIDSEKYCTDEFGMVIPSTILGLKCSESVKIFLPNKKCFTGYVNKVEHDPDIFKVFGILSKENNAGFGFAITRDGKFGGALILKEAKKLYKLEYSENAKGFIFIESVYDEGSEKS